MTLLSRIACFVALVCALAVTATAHPGHGEPGAAHYITAPRHLLTILIASVAVLAACWLLSLLRSQEKV